jgi:arylsulfatase A-like enzyme
MRRENALEFACSGGIQRRQFVKAAASTGAVLALEELAPVGAGAEAGSAKRPNVILIMTDQQRWDSLGCNGNSAAIPPNIDRLALQGVCFDRPYVAQPVCSPSRSSILTGLYPHQTGVVDNDIDLMNHARSFPRLLHEAGYRTGYIGKWHLGPRGEGGATDPAPAYFDVWKGYEGGLAAPRWVGKAKDAYTV